VDVNVHQADDIILVIDEVHTLIGAGAAEGAIDAANILKPALARGELQCIGATTIDEYRKHIEKDPALERRFQPVNVPEPTVDDCIQVRVCSLAQPLLARVCELPLLLLLDTQRSGEVAACVGAHKQTFIKARSDTRAHAAGTLRACIVQHVVETRRWRLVERSAEEADGGGRQSSYASNGTLGPLQILGGLRERYESHHKLTYTDEALSAAAKLAHQYISDRFLPDKAIDLIDEAGSRVRLRHAALPEEARELDKELKVEMHSRPPLLN
jgi:hypothetical protein